MTKFDRSCTVPCHVHSKVRCASCIFSRHSQVLVKIVSTHTMFPLTVILHYVPEKFCHNLQTSADFNKTWLTMSWINLLQNNLNVLHLTWIIRRPNVSRNALRFTVVLFYQTPTLRHCAAAAHQMYTTSSLVEYTLNTPTQHSPPSLS